MQVAYKLIREKFTSRVTLLRRERTIVVEYLDGPFRRMENRWTFRPLDDGTGCEASGKAGAVTACEVEFFISYEFRSRTLGLLMGAMFDAAFSRFSAAFEKRADAIYGKRPVPSS